MQSFLKNLSNNKDPNSLANKLRRKRFSLFLNLIKDLPKPIQIIDVGGTELFWEQMGFSGNPDIEITLLNLKSEPVKNPNIKSISGDARDMKQFAEKEFDIAFSNSVIEHVGDFNDQGRMAAEMKRIARGIFLQTPNYYFPVEPHFLFPFFQFMPLWLKTRLLMNFNLGWHTRISDKEKAREICRTIRLLKKSELKKLFPESEIHKEYFFGMVKSFIVKQKIAPEN
ncbi:MAG: class I SAM-dependent methyltransferase [Bacteroidales bacterium]|jgi:ubiquinone/menaquinone biosynthesis C-methylase UbiE|nr:class I SAM-dependent methyltransferase [Bacteroidales bacterium]